MTRLADPIWNELPESVVRKLILVIAGTKDLAAVSADERQAIRDAMIGTRADGQSLSRWRSRAYGLLRQRGWVQ